MKRDMIEKVCEAIYANDTPPFRPLQTDEHIIVAVSYPHGPVSGTRTDEAEYLRRVGESVACDLKKNLLIVATRTFLESGEPLKTFFSDTLYNYDKGGQKLLDDYIENSVQSSDYITQMTVETEPKRVVGRLLEMETDEDDDEEMDNLKDYYVVVLRWNNLQVDKAVASGYNLHQFVEDGLRG